MKIQVVIHNGLQH